MKKTQRWDHGVRGIGIGIGDCTISPLYSACNSGVNACSRRVKALSVCLPVFLQTRPGEATPRRPVSIPWLLCSSFSNISSWLNSKFFLEILDYSFFCNHAKKSVKLMKVKRLFNKPKNSLFQRVNTTYSFLCLLPAANLRDHTDKKNCNFDSTLSP